MTNSSDSPATDYVLYSDGGSNGTNNSAGACIVEDTKSGKRFHLAVMLGPGTNNEAEIASSLVGYSFLLSLGDRGGKPTVHWVADSEYVLKSAASYIHNWQRNGWKTADKKPVKNQGLWRSYLLLAEHFKISCEHVRGHTGHTENEACDEAVQWVKARGADLFEARSVLETAEIDTTAGLDMWAIVDGSRWLENLRQEKPDEETMLWFVKVLKGVDQALGDSSAPLKVPADGDGKLLAPALKKIKEACLAADKAAVKSPKAKALAKDLRSLLDDYE